jgi:hypothetical protein
VGLRLGSIAILADLTPSGTIVVEELVRDTPAMLRYLDRVACSAAF